VGWSDARLRGVLRVGLGQPAADAAHVLHQLRVLPGGLLPDRALQRAPLRVHRRQPRPPPHPVGHAAAPAPAHALAPRPPAHGRQRRPVRAQVPARRPRARHHRRRLPRPQRHRRHAVRARRMVRQRRGVPGGGQQLGAQAGARRRAPAEAHGQGRQVRGLRQQPVQVATM
jgi:hypothetical protein